MKKRLFYEEAAYVIGLMLLSFGIALMDRADFGVSMEVAPPYLIYLKVSQKLSFFTFGMSEFVWQMLLFFLMLCLVRKIKISYLGSIVTAILYAFLLDVSIKITPVFSMCTLPHRVVGFLIAMFCCQIGIALLFHSYLTPLMYELFVQEVAGAENIRLYRFKTIFDCCSCAIGILFSFSFFGFGVFEGVKFGTIICAIINGKMIEIFSAFFEKYYVFEKKYGSVKVIER